MDIESARLAYVPFKRFPAGHVFIIFCLSSGEEIVISPEADLGPETSFSLMRGLGKSYPLQYQVQQASVFLDKYRLEGRNVKEQRINLNSQQLNHLYQAMLVRADLLQKQTEWYHTLFNSCVTNLMVHLEKARGRRFLLMRFVLPLCPVLLTTAQHNSR